jgi:hypothetical protein
MEETISMAPAWQTAVEQATNPESAGPTSGWVRQFYLPDALVRSRLTSLTHSCPGGEMPRSRAAAGPAQLLCRPGGLEGMNQGCRRVSLRTRPCSSV